MIKPSNPAGSGSLLSFVSPLILKYEREREARIRTESNTWYKCWEVCGIENH